MTNHPTLLERFQQSACYDVVTTKRREPALYANVIITDCYSKDFWYREIVGMELFCEIVCAPRDWINPHGGIIVKSAVVVRLTGSQVEIGRPLYPTDFVIT